MNNTKHDAEEKSERSSERRAGLNRRDAMKLLGAGAGAAAMAAFPEMAPAKPVHLTPSRYKRPALQATNNVDIFVKPNPVQFDASGNGVLTFTVGNFGPNPTEGQIQVLVLTPFFANLDSPLPPGFTPLFTDPRPNVPEVAQTIISPGLAPGMMVSFSVPLVMVGNPMPVPNSGRVIANLDPNFDSGINLADNVRRYSVIFPGSLDGTPSGNPVNLFFTYAKPVLNSGRTSSMTVRVFAEAGQATSNPFFTYVTPHLVRLNPSALRPLPGVNPQILFPLPESGLVPGPVPQILLTRIPRLPINLGTGATLNFPLTPTGTGGAPTRFGRGIVIPGPGDFDPDPTVALSSLDILQLS